MAERKTNELLNELKALKKENSELKALLKKQNKEFKKDSSFNRESKILKQLNDFSLKLSYLPHNEIFPYIISRVKTIFHVKAAFINTYDETSSEMVLQHSTLSDEENAKVVKLLGGKLLNGRFSVSEIDYKRISSKVYEKVPSLHVLTFGAIPSLIGKSIEKLFGFDWFAALGLMHEEKLVGTMILAGSNKQSFPEEKIISVFGGMVANALVRKDAEEKLLETQKRYQNIVDSSPLGMHIYELKENDKLVFIGANPAADRILGFDHKLIIGKTIEEAFPPLINTEVPAKYREVIRNNTSWKTEQINYKDNNIIGAFEVLAFRVSENQMVARFLEITERLKKEQIRKAEEEKLSITLNSIGDGVIATDRDGCITTMNPVAEKLCGWRIEDARGKLLNEVFDIVDATTKEKLDNPVQKVLNTGSVVELSNHTVLISKNGEERNISDSAAPIRDKMNNIQGVVLVFSDVTEAYNSRKALKESEEKFRALAENVPGVIYLCKNDERWTMLYLNDAVENLTGYTKDDFYNDTISFADLYHPDDKEYVYKEVEASLNNNVPFHLEYRIIDKYNNCKWIDEKGTRIINENNIELIEGFLSDITERKMFENVLKKEKERISTILDLVGDPIFVKDDQHRFTLANRAFYEMVGLGKENVIGNTLAEGIPLDEMQHFRKVDRMVLDTGVPDTREEELTINNQTRTILTSKTRFIDESGNKLLVGSIHDITERKNAEKEKIHLNDLMKYIIGNTKSSVSVFDTQMNYIFVSDRYFEDLHLTDKNIIGRNHYDVFPDLPQFLRDIHKRSIQGETINGEGDALVHSDGSIDWANWTCMPWFKSDSSIGGIIIYLEVITDRKKAEAELILSKEKTEEINANVTAIIEGTEESIWAFDTDFNILYINNVFQKQFCEAFGVWLEKGSSLLQALPEQIRPFWKQRYDRVLSNEQFTIVDEMETAIGKAYVQVTFNPIIKNEVVIGGSCFGSDITERKRVEEKILESESQFKSLFNNAADAIFIADAETGIIVNANHTAEKMLNISLEKIIGKHQSELHPDEIKNHSEDSFKKHKSQAEEMNLSNLVESIVLNSNGNHIPVEVIASKVLYQGKNCIMGIFRDITDRKRAENELKIREQRFEQLLQNSFDTIVLLDSNGIQKYVSASAERMHGYTQAELVDIPVIDVMIHPDDREHVVEAFQRILTTGEGGAQYRHKRKGGGWVYLEARGTNQLNNPDICGIVVNVRDITERKKTEEELQKSQALFAAFMDQIPGLVLIKDSELRPIFVNRTFRERLPADDWMGKLPEECFPSELATEIRARDEAALQAGFEKYEETWSSLDGSVSTYETRKFKIQLSNTISLLGALIIDITERKLAEKALKENEELYRKLLTTVPDLIVHTDLRGNITFINEFTFPTLRYIPSDTFLGKNMLSFISEEDLPRAIENTKLMFENKLGIKEYKLKFADESVMDAEVNGDVIYDADDNPVGMVYVIRDITERKKMEIEKQKMIEDLVVAKEKAEEMNKAKSNFFANMSHELRTPFVGIMGYAELLADSNLSPDEKYMVEGIIKASIRMQNTLSKILGLARLESTTVEVQKTKVYVNELITNLYESFRGGAIHKGISFEKEVNFEELVIDSDDIIIKDILQNFVNNAIKFTSQGEVKIAADIQKQNEVNKLVIKVSDTGIGIPEEKLEMIWEPFRQVSEGKSRSFEGTGLGLSIVKKSSDLLGGKVYVESEYKKGSVFVFELPFSA